MTLENELGLFTNDSTITVSETKPGTSAENNTQNCRTQGKFPKALVIGLEQGPGQSQSVQPFLPLQFMGYKLQFQGISAQKQVE